MLFDPAFNFAWLSGVTTRRAVIGISFTCCYAPDVDFYHADRSAVKPESFTLLTVSVNDGSSAKTVQPVYIPLISPKPSNRYSDISAFVGAIGSIPHDDASECLRLAIWRFGEVAISSSSLSAYGWYPEGSG